MQEQIFRGYQTLVGCFHIVQILCVAADSVGSVCGTFSDGKVPAESIMTDGSGFANANFFHLLQQQFQWETFPSAVQMRIEGAKVL